MRSRFAALFNSSYTSSFVLEKKKKTEKEEEEMGPRTKRRQVG